MSFEVESEVRRMAMKTKMMVTRGVVMGALMCSMAGLAQGTSSTVKDDLFAGTEIFAKGASDVTEITMDPDTLGLVGGDKGPRAHSMVLNVVRTYEYDKPGMYNIEDVEKFRSKLMTGDWHCSVHTRSLKTGESTDVCNKRRTDDLAESAIITVEPKELTFIHTIRKKGPGEQGDMSDMMLLRAGHGMASLAAIDPGAFVDMEIAKAKMSGMSGSFLGNSIADGISGSVPHRFFMMRAPDMSGLQEQMDSLKKQLSNETDPKKLQELQDQTKQLEEQMQRVGPTSPPLPDLPKIVPETQKVVPDVPVEPTAPAVPQ